MTTARLVHIAVSLAVMSTIVAVVATGLLLVNGIEAGGIYSLSLFFVGTVYPWIGVRVVAREPRNAVGWLLLAGGCLWAAAFLLPQYALFATSPGRGLPVAGTAAWLGDWIWIPGTVLLLTFLPLLFPDGHLPSRRWVAAAAVLAVIGVVAVGAQAMVAWPFQNDVSFLVTGDVMSATPPGPMHDIADLSNLLVFLTPLVAAVGVASRWRASTGVQRLQVSWFAYAIAITATLAFVGGATQIGGLLAALTYLIALALMPTAIGIAILRYHLYDIDRIISRTISWTVTTGAIVIVFAGIVVGLQGILTKVTGGNTVAVAASTLVAFALFQPLRRRVQAAVDRRFNRSGYDAQHTVDAFAQQLRGEVDLETLRSSLVSTSRDVVLPRDASLWLRPAPDSRP